MEAASSIRVSMVMIAAWACVLLLSTGLAASQSVESADPGLDAPYASDYTLSAPNYTRLAGGTPPPPLPCLCVAFLCKPLLNLHLAKGSRNNLANTAWNAGSTAYISSTSRLIKSTFNPLHLQFRPHIQLNR
jgi:hypothetical protein